LAKVGARGIGACAVVRYAVVVNAECELPARRQSMRGGVASQYAFATP